MGRSRWYLEPRRAAAGAPLAPVDLRIETAITVLLDRLPSTAVGRL